MTARHPSAQGSILPATFAIVALAGSLLVLSSDRVLATSRLQQLGNARQQATYAAESVAALREVALARLAANNDLAGLDNGPNPNSGVEWFGNCLVRWRIEPVRVVNPNGSFTVNPVADVNSLPPGGAYLPNAEFYTYRVATEAFALTDANDATATPWSDATDRQCVVQATRMVQLRLNSLFKYAIFYAAEGTTGDLEFWVGTSIAVGGAVHSNGAIYIGGQGNQYLSGNYHNSASDGGDVTIGGGGGSRVTVTGIDGVFRMRKGGNTLAFRNPTHPLYNAALGLGDIPSPFAVPPDLVNPNDNGVMTGNANLNGDQPGSGKHRFNDIAFSTAVDSRSPGWLGASPFGQYVRDSQVGATVVKTLSNIPELAGRPFEAQRIAAAGQALYWKDPANIDGIAANDREFTINPTANSRALYYTDFAGANYTPTDVALNGLGAPRRAIMAENLPLYTFAGNVRDVWPDSVSTPASDPDTGFALTEARGHYLTQALNGIPGTTTTGLVIRERAAQNITFFAGAKPDLATYGGIFANFAIDYAKYMKSQFQVRIGGRDVTNVFFSQIAAVATSDADFLCREDSFVNMRDATAMQVFYGVRRDDYFNNLTNVPYRVNVLHLNLVRVQEFIKNTDWNTLDLAYIGTDKVRDRFNGLIYAARTRRSLTFHALLRPTLVFNKYVLNANYTLPAVADFPFKVREGSGPIETFHCGVRVSNGGDINWNHIAAANPLGTSGLTVITPNMCYLHGDYNIVTHPDASGTARITPCAIFSDGLAALSNRWNDSEHQTADTSTRDASETTYNLSLVINNVPTDDLNAVDEGSGAVANVVRFLENWGGRTYAFRGSLVVMNRMRYGYTTLGANTCALNANTNFYSPPRRQLNFNTDLLSRAGQPPFTPFGVQVIRTVSTLVPVD